LRPFFIVSSTASTISFFALHLTQYPSGIEKMAARQLHASRSCYREYGPVWNIVNYVKEGC
jgi:hypothetical protein